MAILSDSRPLVLGSYPCGLTYTQSNFVFSSLLPTLISLNLVIPSKRARLQEDGPLKINLVSPSVPNRSCFSQHGIKKPLFHSV